MERFVSSTGCWLWLACVIALTGSRVGAAEPEGRSGREAVLFEGLWEYGRPIETSSAEAQRWFDQGLGFLFAYNHDEAIRAFRESAERDARSPMPHWGIAYANGPHINFPIVDEAHAAAAWEALERAQELSGNGTEVERDLVAALSKRYAMPQPEDRAPLDRAYADAMREVWRKHPRDADVGALFAEALMDLRPWDQWTLAGEPQPDTEEILQTLEAVLALSPRHPLSLHLYIHAVEGSPFPERASHAAETLRRLPLKFGHLVHMPSHIDVRLGDWEKAIETNERAIAADAAYRAVVPEQGFYRAYMAHNHHMLAYGAMMLGMSARATDAIETMLDEIPPEFVEANGPVIDAFFSMPYEMHLRFGRWDEMLAEPEPPESLPVTRTMRLFGRGVSFAAKRDAASARIEQQRFREAVKALPDDAVFVLNKAADVLAVADAMLEGEILYREGKVDEAVAALKASISLEDALRYTEPPDWIQPVRHVLGATLSDAGRWAEAEQVYRADLKKHPHNGWSLYGLATALRKQGRAAEAQMVHQQFVEAWRHADTKLNSSCLCLPVRE